MKKDLPALPGQTIRFISDLHLGHAKSAIRDVEQIRFLLEGCRILVICGDFSETREEDFLERAGKLRRDFETMCSEAGVELIILAGNHDPDEEHSVLTCLDGRIAALHGHCLFKQVSPWGREYLNNKPLYKRTIREYKDADINLEHRMELARTIAKLVLPPTCPEDPAKVPTWKRSKPVRFFQHACWPPERPLQILRAWLMMRSRIKDFRKRFLPEAEVICYGHLHRRDIHFSQDKLYVNLGALFQYASGYAVEVKDFSLEVREVSADGWGQTAFRHTIRPLNE